jgi:hypothetical protein
LSDSSNTFSVNESQVDHDSLNQFVSSEHVDHSAVTISAGTALSGGGDLTASRTLNVSGPLTGIPFKTSGDNLEWQAEANTNDLILKNTTASQTLLKVDQDTGTVFAAGDVVAFGLSGGGGSGSTSGLQATAPLNLDTTTDPDTISLSVGSGLTVTNGTLEADGSVGVSSVFGRTGDVTASAGDYSASQISGFDEKAQDAVGTIMSGGGAASVTYDDAGNTITISATDTQLSDSEVQTAINNDSDHGSTAKHNYFSGNYSDLSGTPSIAYNSTIPADDFTSTEVSNLRGGQLDDGSTPWASNNFFDAGDARSAVEGTSDVADLVGGLGTSGQVPQTDGTNVSWVTLAAADISGVSPDSTSNAHHAVFEPADYNPVSDVEAHGNALAIDISGDADTLDGFDASDTIAPADWSTNGTRDLKVHGQRAMVGFNGGRLVVGFSNDFTFTEYESGKHIFKNGNVGIGSTSPSYALEVSGDARSTGEVEAFLGSDRRLKTHLDPLDSALDKVDELTGYNFDWRDNDSVMPHKRGNTDVGVIAQEVEQVLPNAVKEFADGHSKGYKSVSYDKLVPLLIEAIKDLRSQVNQLQ